MKCPVLGANVTRVTDLEGEMPKLICAEYDEPTGICRLKKERRSRRDVVATPRARV